MFSLTLRPAPAQSLSSYAGPVYSGGTKSVVGTTKYGPNTNNQFLYSYGANAPATTSPYSTGSSSGDVKAEFTWSAGPTPPAVIVMQQSEAFWNGYSGTTGSASNPLGGTDPGQGQEWTATKYTVQEAPPAVLDVVCSGLSASATAPSAPNGGSCDAKASYQASVSPVTITLSGYTSVGGAQQAVTGQTISASLSLNGGPGTLSNYKWSTTGGSPFETWHSNVIPQLTALSTTDNNAKAVTFTFNDATNNDTVYVTCTATVTFPDNTTGTITAQSQPVTFFQPTAVWIVNGPDNINTPGFGHDTTDIGANRMGAEIDWNPVTITLPPALKSVGGTGAFGQTIQTLNGTMTRYDAPTTYINKVQINNNTDGSGNPIYINPPSNMLDMSFPIYGNSENWYANGGMGDTGDTPAQPYTGNVSIDSGTNNWYKSNMVSASFSTWLVYQPPGGVWVPLQMISWDWYGSASITNGAWTFAGNLDAPTSKTDSNGVGAITSTPPSWTSVKTGGVMHP